MFSEYILRALNSLNTPEEKLAALCKKYADLHEEHRVLQTSFKTQQRTMVNVGHCVVRKLWSITNSTLFMSLFLVHVVIAQFDKRLVSTSCIKEQVDKCNIIVVSYTIKSWLSVRVCKFHPAFRLGSTHESWCHHHTLWHYTELPDLDLVFQNCAYLDAK